MSGWIGQTLLGRYRVLERLGAGGMAAVYLAEDIKRPGWKVAVKHPLRAHDAPASRISDEELRRRFRTEVQKLIALGELPNVARIEDQGEHEGVPFYVMRYLAGGPLQRRLEAGPQGPDAVVAWALPIARALDRLHSRRPMLVHRDVKPHNILFDEYDQPHLADFGIVKELSEEWGTTGAENSVIGSPPYMAPEQLLKDGEPDGRTDQYALAASMYQALTGQPPRYETRAPTAGTPPTGPGAARRKRLLPARELAAHLAPAASAALERGLAKEQDERFPTCVALVEAFAAGLSAETSVGGSGGGATVLRPGVGTQGHAPHGEQTCPRRGRWPLVLLALAALGGIGYAALQALVSPSATPAGPGAAPAPAAAPTPGPAPGPAPAPAPAAPAVPAWAKVSSAQDAEAQRLGVPVAYEEPTTGMRFVLIAGGSFQMGSPDGETGRYSDEGPVHTVRLSAYYLSVTETTNAQYKRFKADHDGRFDGPTQPVEMVSHADAEAFASWLNGQGAEKGYRLPTEAEWEYAARAGTSTRWSFGEDESRLGEYAWFDGNSGSQTHPVGEKQANPWGLYDMHGNVWEWCADDHHSNYKDAPTDGSAWIDSPRAAVRVVRGGGWDDDARNLRSAFREGVTPSLRDGDPGFRLARPVTAR